MNDTSAAWTIPRHSGAMWTQTRAVAARTCPTLLPGFLASLGHMRPVLRQHVAIMGDTTMEDTIMVGTIMGDPATVDTTLEDPAMADTTMEDPSTVDTTMVDTTMADPMVDTIMVGITMVHPAMVDILADPHPAE